MKTRKTILCILFVLSLLLSACQKQETSPGGVPTENNPASEPSQDPKQSPELMPTRVQTNSDWDAVVARLESLRGVSIQSLHRKGWFHQEIEHLDVIARSNPNYPMPADCINELFVEIDAYGKQTGNRVMFSYNLDKTLLYSLVVGQSSGKTLTITFSYPDGKQGETLTVEDNSTLAVPVDALIYPYVQELTQFENPLRQMDDRDALFDGKAVFEIKALMNHSVGSEGVVIEAFPEAFNKTLISMSIGSETGIPWMRMREVIGLSGTSYLQQSDRVLTWEVLDSLPAEIEQQWRDALAKLP